MKQDVRVNAISISDYLDICLHCQDKIVLAACDEKNSNFSLCSAKWQDKTPLLHSVYLRQINDLTSGIRVAHTARSNKTSTVRSLPTGK